MNPLISVIVPVYKVEKFLDRCITSIVEQTYTNLEIILVDDGSPDNSGKICDEWAKKDSRIKVIHKENGGLSDARNCGTEIAHGEYITFIDSDDYVLPEYVEYLYNNLKEHDADISCCDLFEVYNKERVTCFKENDSLNSIKIISGRDACFEMYSQKYMVYLIIAPCKLYRKELIRKFPFPIGKLHEDEATTYKFLFHSKKLSLGDKKLYAYFQNENSITHINNEKRINDITLAFSDRAKYFKKSDERDLEIAAWDCLASFYIYNAIDENRRLYKEQINFLKVRILKKDLSLKETIKILVYIISPSVYKKIINIIGRLC